MDFMDFLGVVAWCCVFVIAAAAAVVVVVPVALFIMVLAGTSKMLTPRIPAQRRVWSEEERAERLEGEA